MDAFLSAIIVILAAALAATAWIAFRRRVPAAPEPLPAQENGEGQALTLIQNQINELTRTIETKLGESARATAESTNKAFAQASESSRLIKEITQELARVGEGQRQVASVADNLKNLRDILKNPKQRGVLGEYYLETVLKNVLPPSSYKLQYGFKDGTIVDAAIITKDGIIPIDSKFSLENYNRILEAPDETERDRFETAFANDLKLRIDETSKYVKPEEGTLGFAFMFIPSEAVYYDLLVNKVGTVKASNQNLVEYASGRKNVIVVSPTTFHAYLLTVLQGLRALQVEESAREMHKRVQDLAKHLVNYQEFALKVGKNLATTVSAYDAAGREFGKINKDIYRITDEETGLELPTVKKPDEGGGDAPLLG